MLNGMINVASETLIAQNTRYLTISIVRIASAIAKPSHEASRQALHHQWPVYRLLHMSYR